MSTVLRLSFKLNAQDAAAWDRARIAAVANRRARGYGFGTSPLEHSAVLWFLLQPYRLEAGRTVHERSQTAAGAGGLDGPTNQAGQTASRLPHTTAIVASLMGDIERRRRPRQTTLQQGIARAKRKSKGGR